jgi:hypothetical protein
VGGKSIRSEPNRELPQQIVEERREQDLKRVSFLEIYLKQEVSLLQGLESSKE